MSTAFLFLQGSAAWLAANHLQMFHEIAKPGFAATLGQLRRGELFKSHSKKRSVKMNQAVTSRRLRCWQMLWGLLLAAGLAACGVPQGST
ncbi:MAG: hypothetical protein JO200_19595, partial [Comamonas sp.]|nr:hypothetical protein [Comamonas sp.]